MVWLSVAEFVRHQHGRHDRSLLERHALQAIAVVEGDAEASRTLTLKEGKGYEVYRLTESGAVAAVTIRVLRGKPYFPADR